jgi:hypothetical protein
MDIDSILHQPKTHSILDSYIRKNRAKEAKRVQRSQAMLYTLREHNDFTTQLLLNHEKEEVRFIWPGFQLQKYTNN